MKQLEFFCGGYYRVDDINYLCHSVTVCFLLETYQTAVTSLIHKCTKRTHKYIYIHTNLAYTSTMKSTKVQTLGVMAAVYALHVR